MKTKLITLLCLSAIASSCNTAHYRMHTSINRDGSATREINTSTDSAFMAGDMSANPFLFRLDGSWAMTDCDSVTTDYPAGRPYVTIKKTVASIEDFSAGLQYEDYKRSLAAPAESLRKRFGWFYTYYDFEAVYHEITDKGDISLDSYLNADEQALWLQGDMSPYAGFNGIELASLLGDIESKFWNWYNRSVYEVFFGVILKFSDGGPYFASLTAEKEKIFSENSKNIKPLEFTFEDFRKMLDSHFAIDYFSALYLDNREAMDAEVDAGILITQIFDTTISYGLTMPGKVMATNASSSNDGVLEWKVDAWRVLSADYPLTAKSRTPNYWAWLITLLVVASPACFFIVAGRKRK